MCMQVDSDTTKKIESFLSKKKGFWIMSCIQNPSRHRIDPKKKWMTKKIFGSRIIDFDNWVIAQSLLLNHYNS